MPRPRARPDPYLLSKVSTLYYVQNQTQQEIADRLQISRPKVSRLLQEAQEQGIVQITIAPPTGMHLELESRLEAAFGLVEARVVEAPTGNREEAVRRIGAAAAGYLTRTLQPRTTIGVAWGTTLNAMVQALTPLPSEGVRVVQTLGGVGPPGSEAYAARLASRAAELLGGEAVLLPAPGIVGTASARDVLGGDPHVQAALRELDSLDTLFVGIGSLATNAVLTDGNSLPPGTYAELQDAGAVGDLALRFFDSSGALVRTSLDGRILGITPDQLRRVKRVVAVAGGRDKLRAIRGALNGGLIHVLVTDVHTAEALTTSLP